MSRAPLSARRRSATRWTAAGVASAAVLTLTGTWSAPAASAVVADAACPLAKPVAELAPDQPVHGLTVSRGTTPAPFTGTVVGVLHDGISLDVDMILVDLSSDAIDAAGGIWSGMSGSPVYADDGRLIGAVSYGLAFGPSKLAGVTPAADMQKLLSAVPGSTTGLAPTKVDLPARLETRLVSSGVATSSEAASGLTRLRLPLSITGLGSEQRLGLVAKALGRQRSQVTMAGRYSAAGEPAPLVAGGNVAAALSYGDVTAAGVGTVTAVCGGEVLAFGHPMLWSGPSQLSLHAASAVAVQDDPTFPPFKVANIDPRPIGTVTQDRMAGILGVPGATPATSDITSRVGMEDGVVRKGATHVVLPEAVPDLAFSHLLSNLDAVFNGVGKGTSRVRWTLTGTRANGRSFTVTRRDVVASNYDLTFESAWNLVNTLYTLQFNEFESISLDTVGVTSTLSRDYDRYTFKRAEVRRGGRWVPLTRRSGLVLPAASRQTFRVTLDSDHHGTLRATKRMWLSRDMAGRMGELQFTGGSNLNGGDEEDMYFFAEEGYPGQSSKSFDDVLAEVRTQPSNDDMLTELTFYNRRGRATQTLTRHQLTGLPVTGGLTVPVMVRPRH